MHPRALAGVALSLIALAWGSTPAAASAHLDAPAEQPPAAGHIDPAAKDIIDRMKQAARETQSVSYTVFSQSDREGDEQPKRAAVVFRVVADPEQSMFPVDLYRVTTLDTSGQPVVGWSGTPQRVQKIDHAKRKLLTLDLNGEEATPAREVWEVLPNWLLQEHGPGDQTKIVSASLLAEADFGGVPCDVVRYVRERTFDVPAEEPDGGDGNAPRVVPAKIILTSTRHIGKNDHLPRRIETVAAFENMPPDSGAEGWTLVIEITNLKVHSTLAEGDVLWTAPEGFESAKGTEQQIGVQVGEPDAPELAFKAGDEAPDFTLSDTEGRQWTMSGLRGKVVLLDFWATWCGPCKAVMPSIQLLHEKFAGKPVEIIGVNVWERGKAAAKAGGDYMKSRNYTYTCLVQGEELAKAYNVSGIPTLVLIGADGRILHTSVGVMPDEERRLAELIEGELAKRN